MALFENVLDKTKSPEQFCHTVDVNMNWNKI